MNLTLCALVLLIPATLLAAIQTQDVPYTAGDAHLKGTLIYDDTAIPNAPGVLVFPEWWGANDYAKSRARQLADLGYVAFVADLYGDGKTTDDPKQAGTWAGELRKNPQFMVERAKAALDAFTKTGKPDRARIAAIGYCMGGNVALNLAWSGADLKSVVGFHCDLVNRLDSKQRPKAKILILNGAADKNVGEEETARFRKQMEEVQADWLLVLYGGALHAYTNPNADKHRDLGIGYNQTADQRSWQHMRQFLTETLGDPKALPRQR